MKEKLTLKNPIMVNGKQISEVSYDIEEITGILFAEADNRKMTSAGARNGNLAGAAELDYSLQLYLGYAAIIALNPEIDWSDLEREKGSDVMQIMRIGRNFITLSVRESPGEGSEEPSEISLEPTTPRSSSSKKSE